MSAWGAGAQARGNGTAGSGDITPLAPAAVYPPCEGRAAYPKRVVPHTPYRVNLAHRRRDGGSLWGTVASIDPGPECPGKSSSRGGRNGKENTFDAHARRTRDRTVAELRDGPEAPGERQRHDGRPHGAARGFVPDEEGLLEGRHGQRLRLRRRHHPALHRTEGRRGQTAVSGRRRVATPCASCRRPACTTRPTS